MPEAAPVPAAAGGPGGADCLRPGAAAMEPGWREYEVRLASHRCARDRVLPVPALEPGGMMSDLAAFLAARLDEDEHWAHMAEAGWPPENALAASEDPEHYAFMATDITPSKATFIRRHDPARVLREVAAKRAILDEYRSEEH